MPVFLILAFVFIALVCVVTVGFVGLWGSTLAGFLVARQKKWGTVKVAAGVVLALLTSAPIFLVGWIAYHSGTPKSAFEQEFGQPQPAGVQVIRSERWEGPDNGYGEFVFRMTRAQFDAIRPPEFERSTVMNLASSKASLPEWWRESREGTEVWCYKADRWHGAPKKQKRRHGFTKEQAFLTWDDDGLVQLWWEGID